MKYTYALFCLLLTACTHSIPKEDNIQFVVEHHNMDSHQGMGTFYFTSKYLVIENGGRFTVLDEKYKHCKRIEQELDSINGIEFIWQANDTLWLFHPTKDGKGEKWFVHNDVVINTGEVLYNDIVTDEFWNLYPRATQKVHNVVTDCMGEFGGYAFFYDERTKRTYGYYGSECVSQVLYKDSVYFLIRNSNHLFGSSSVVKIEDPTLLCEVEHINDMAHYIEYRDTCRKYYCVGDTYELKEPKGYTVYAEAQKRLLPISFLYRDELYSIASYNDTLQGRYQIMKHEQDSLLLEQIIDGNTIATELRVDKTNEQNRFAACVFTPQRTMDVIVVTGNKIDVLHFK